MNAAARRTDDSRTFRNEDLVLAVKPHDPAKWDESRYEAFLDALCGHRNYQKEAIRTVLSYWLGGRYSDLRQLAKENFETNEELRHRWGRWDSMAPHLQLPEQLACSLDLATGTGKSFVLYGIAAILLADMAAGAIARSYRTDERKDADRWRKMLAGKIEDVWEFAG